MELQIIEGNHIELRKVFTGVTFRTEDDETLDVCMRDTGFEIRYNRTWYELKNGAFNKMRKNVVLGELREVIGLALSHCDSNDSIIHGKLGLKLRNVLKDFDQL